MGHPSVEQIAQRAFDLGLLTERQLQEVWSSFGSRAASLNDFLQILVRREYLTNYQVERLINNNRTGFFYGDYKVLYLVGSGSFARVFRAVHRKTGQVVALKVLRNRFAENSIQANQFLLEGKVGCTLRHPNIVAIYDVMSPGRTHVIVMEFVEGRNLREFVQIRKKIDPVEATRLITGLTDGLRYAFEHGVTHRDLKMSNILVSSRGEAKLVDFGMAAMDETLADDRMADLPNTRAIDYAALERATGVRKDDTRSDIYFLGCIYYNMLSGKPPFPETRDRMQRLSKQKFIDIVPIQRLEPAIPSAVALVVNKAMMLDPARRYSAPSAMLADLRVAAKRLANGTADQVDGFDGDPAATGNPSALAPRESAPLPEAESERSVMVIESNIQMQNIFRDGFKRIGYRVLMTSNPDHAASRILQNAAIADCLVINAQFLGESALAMFNQLAENPKTKQIPAMLLLDENQHAWESRAETTPTRVVLRLPVTMRKLLGSVQALITSAAPK